MKNWKDIKDGYIFIYLAVFFVNSCKKEINTHVYCNIISSK